MSPQKIIISSTSKPKLASTDKKLDRLRRGPYQLDDTSHKNNNDGAGTGTGSGTINNSLLLRPITLDMTANNNETTMVSKTVSGGVTTVN